MLFQVGCGGNPERPEARSRESKGTWSFGMVCIPFPWPHANKKVNKTSQSHKLQIESFLLFPN